MAPVYTRYRADMAAGYSGTPLSQKLGISAGGRVAVLAAPPRFELGPLPDGVRPVRRLPDAADVVLFFAPDYAALAQRWDALARAVFPAGGLWVAWPKRAAGVPTDLTEDVIRDHALARRLVDNKVCAIDEVWSGLRLVWRKEHR